MNKDELQNLPIKEQIKGLIEFCESISEQRAKMQNKYDAILDAAETKYPNDEDFEKYEDFISERIDSADIIEFRDFLIEVKSINKRIMALCSSIVNRGKKNESKR